MQLPLASVFFGYSIVPKLDFCRFVEVDFSKMPEIWHIRRFSEHPRKSAGVEKLVSTREKPWKTSASIP
jgi:hypothetical protein